LAPYQVGFVESAIIGFESLTIRAVGYVGEWDLSKGDLIEHKIHDRAVDRMALSVDMIVTCNAHAILVFNISNCLLVLPGFFPPFHEFDAVEMIKQFSSRVYCYSLLLSGNVVYIGSNESVIQWNMVTDTVVRLEGYPGLS
jgi:hypothetical protein